MLPQTLGRLEHSSPRSNSLPFRAGLGLWCIQPPHSRHLQSSLTASYRGSDSVSIANGNSLPIHSSVQGILPLLDSHFADIILWKCWGVSIVVVVVATVAWLMLEKSGLSFLTISSDVLLILIILRFIWANSAGILKTSLRPLPELVLSEEMVNNAAASFRAKVNNILLVAHDIAHGKDFRSFFQVVVFLWLLSVMGSFFSFTTLAYIGSILLMIVPALYNKYEEHVDRYAGLVHQSFSKHYRLVDETVLRRLPSRRIPREKID